MAKFDEWTPVYAETSLPAGAYDLKLNDKNGYFTEIRTTFAEEISSSELDKLMTKNMDRWVMVFSAKTVPFPDSMPTVTMDEKDYEFLVSLAMDGVSKMGRASRIMNNKLLFRVISNARRSH